MLSTLRDAWKVPELKGKMIYTLLMILVFRIGASVPVPGVDTGVIAQMFDTSQAGGLLSFLDLMSGGAFKNFTVFALNIYPYITASIILQLLTVAIPSLESLAKEGDVGRKKISKYTKYLTIVLAVVQAVGLSLGFFNQAIMDRSFMSVAVVVITLTAGTCFLVWLGGQITEKGVGNGISLIIFIGIVSGAPSGAARLFELYKAGAAGIVSIVAFLVIALLIIVGVIIIQEGQRKIPVQYAKRVVGRKMYGGQSTHIPIKVLMAGVIPVIFSTSLLQFPQIVALFFKGGFADFVTKYLTLGGTLGTWIYSILNVILILFFTYFYTAIQFNPIEYANNLKQNGGFIPGIRPGKPTSDYLGKILSKITFLGAIVLAIIATVPVIVESILGLGIQFGGTAVLIVVGVVLETMKQLETQMLMRHYKGFLK
ncbi:protein translocase subunit SecY [Andreesenia angusta]|uniref:Protein translocase subunit SecY n=1 Tax=Andreesenia angusta TaxID=39480 RepID=A0A1S1V7R2_9FIRM|nr:preprotein translocase subunit SecY [Andreesenia angusta]OHW62440.1 protein translocase subunit SecY [Andreesenia angusta]